LTDKVTGEWRRLHNEELYALYSSSDVIRVIKSRRMERTRHVARVEDRRSAYRVFVGKLEGRGPLGKLKLRLEDNIKMNLIKVGWVSMGSIVLP
jgi:hypothetical protein